MKAIVHEAHTEIFPTDDEVRELCKPGAGADTCVMLVMGSGGWECCFHNRGPVLGLIDRAKAGESNAQRLGCARLERFSPAGLSGEVDVPA